MLKRLEKLKSSVQHYVVTYKSESDLIITAEEWQLVNHIILLLEPFFIVTKECSKNNALLSSVIPHARSLTKFVNFYENSEEVSNVCRTLAKK